MSILSNLVSSFAVQKGAGRTVGIDIGTSAIKVVELEDRSGTVTLTTYGELQLGPYEGKGIGEAVTIDPKKEQQALVDTIRESAVKARQAVFAMPLSSSFVTVMSLPDVEGQDLASRVRVEARKYIPTQISEVTLDWAEIAQANSEEKTTQDVLVAAIQNDALRQYNSLLEFVSLPGMPTEIECFSALRALQGGAEDMVVIDIGATVAKLYIARAGLLQRMHRVRAGGALATKRISEVLQVSWEEAETRKREALTVTPSQDILKAHRTCYDRAFVEFRQVIKDFEQTMGSSVGAIYLTGGGVVFPDLASQLKEVLGREVQLATPFSKVAYPAFMEDLMRDIGPGFTVALGAALRAFE